MDEKELERIAKQLGADVGREIDVERISAQVVARLRAGEVIGSRPWWQRTPLLRAAVMAAVIVTGGAIAISVTRDPGPGAEGAELFELQELSTTELTEVLDSLAYEAPVHQAVLGGLDDLDEDQLRELLQAMEG